MIDCWVDSRMYKQTIFSQISPGLPTKNILLLRSSLFKKQLNSPMPTCASKIMLTSLAPSPTARVIGCSLEDLISFTICQRNDLSQMKELFRHIWRTIEKNKKRSKESQCHLGFLQRCHATAENSATVATDFKKDLSVVPMARHLLAGF